MTDNRAWSVRASEQVKQWADLRRKLFDQEGLHPGSHEDSVLCEDSRRLLDDEKRKHRELADEADKKRAG